MEIIITPEGDVKATVKGIKGKRCTDEIAPFVKAAGEKKSESFTPAASERKPKRICFEFPERARVYAKQYKRIL